MAAFLPALVLAPSPQRSFYPNYYPSFGGGLLYLGLTHFHLIRGGGEVERLHQVGHALGHRG